MPRPQLFVSHLLFVALTGICLIGCTASTETGNGTSTTTSTEDGHHHDHDELPTTYAAAVGFLQDTQTQIKSAFDNGSPAECDPAMHQGFEVISSLPQLAASASEEVRQSVQEAADSLMSSYSEIHKGMHGGEVTVVYADVAEQMETALTSLAQADVPAVAADAAHDHHDHEGHDHGHDHGDHGHDDHDHGDHDHSDH